MPIGIHLLAKYTLNCFKGAHTHAYTHTRMVSLTLAQFVLRYLFAQLCVEHLSSIQLYLPVHHSIPGAWHTASLITCSLNNWLNWYTVFNSRCYAFINVPCRGQNTILMPLVKFLRICIQ